jgi:O-6-methylguanine DNA methyltransferase
MNAVPISTLDGQFTAYYSERGLARLEFPRRKEYANHPQRLGRHPPVNTEPVKTLKPETLKDWVCLTTDALQAELEGKPPKRLPPLDFSGGTAFQQKVWQTLLQIVPGQTRTYSEIAEQAGNPQAVRAVGGACGANPIPVLVPCHRVLPKSGNLGGFSGGLNWKFLLLAREGVKI